jgi:hypothetical protein
MTKLQIFCAISPTPWAARAGRPVRKAPVTVADIELRLVRLEALTIRDAYAAAGAELQRPRRTGIICLRSVDPLKVSHEAYVAVNGIGLDAVASALWIPPEEMGTKLLGVLYKLIHAVHPADLKRWFPHASALQTLSAAISATRAADTFDQWIERVKISPFEVAEAMGLAVDQSKDSTLLQILAELKDSMPRKSLETLMKHGIATNFW